MDTFIDDIRKIAAELQLTEAEKFEVYTKAVDQIYGASQVLQGEPEQWTTEAIAEAYRSIGALSLTELAKQAKAKSDEHIQSLKALLLKTEQDLIRVDNDLQRTWPPVIEESKMEIRRNVYFVDTCKEEFTNVSFLNQLLLNTSMSQYYQQLLESMYEKTSEISRNDKSYITHLYAKETAAKNHLWQLIDTISAQKKLTTQELQVLQNKGKDIIEKIRERYRSGHLSSSDVLDVFEELSTARTYIDVDVADTVHDIQIVDDRILLKFLNKR